MEQLKVQIDQMVEQLKQRRLGQSGVDLFEIIGKLEQAKSYLFAEAMRAESQPPPLTSVASPPVAAVWQQPHDVAGQQPPLTGVASQQPPLTGVASQQPPLTGVASPPMAVVLPQPHDVAGQQPPQLADAQWEYIWESTPQDPFFPVTDHPIYWFSPVLTRDEDRAALEVSSKHFRELQCISPPQSFINSSFYNDVGLPLTLESSKLCHGVGITTRPGLLSRAKMGMAIQLIWPTLGSKFSEGATIDIFCQWKSSGSRYMLFLFIEEKVSQEAGPSSRNVRSQEAGPSSRNVRRRKRRSRSILRHPTE